MSVRFLLSLVATLGLATANVATANVCISDAQARNYLQKACANGVNNGACSALLQGCECVACASNSDCGLDEYCLSGACSTYQCASHDDCGPDGYCRTPGVCDSCSDCQGLAEANHFYPIDGECPVCSAECTSHDDCGDSDFCAQWGMVNGIILYGQDGGNPVECRACEECHTFAYAIDGSCPDRCGAAPPCSSHDDCPGFVDGVSLYCHRPAGDQGDGTCRVASLCLIHTVSDAIGGPCPTCASDSECGEGNICSNDDNLLDDERTVCLVGGSDHPGSCTSHENCVGGYCDLEGYCYPCTECSDFNDAIDDECPVCSGGTDELECSSHVECGDDGYCHASGLCDSCIYCDSDHSIDGQCPDCSGGTDDSGSCTSHVECGQDEYCYAEDGAGLCDNCAICSEFNDAIDGECPVCSGGTDELECTSHVECGGDGYCAQWGKVDGSVVIEYADPSSMRACRPCQDCHAFANAIDGSCPDTCGEATSCNSNGECTGQVLDYSLYCHRPADAQGSGTCRATGICYMMGNPIDGECPNCQSDNDCYDGYVCNTGECEVFNPAGQTCLSDDDCGALICIDGVCRHCTSHDVCDGYCYCQTSPCTEGFCDSICGNCALYNDAIGGSDDAIGGSCPDCSGETRRLSELATPKHKRKHKRKHKPKHKPKPKHKHKHKRKHKRKPKRKHKRWSSKQKRWPF